MIGFVIISLIASRLANGQNNAHWCAYICDLFGAKAWVLCLTTEKDRGET